MIKNNKNLVLTVRVPNPDTIAGSLVLAISPERGRGTKDIKRDFTKDFFTYMKFFMIIREYLREMYFIIL